MADHRIGFEIDSSKGVLGAKKFTTAINNIKKALSGLDTAFAKTDKEFKGKSFKSLSKTIKEFNSVKISQASLNRVTELSTAAKSFRAPTQAQSKNLRSFALALRQVQAPKGTAAITKLSSAMKGFKAPTRSQTRNLKDFVKAVGGLKVPRNADAIATALRRITLAARGASRSMVGLRSSVSKLGMRKLAIESRAAAGGMKGFGGSMNVAAQGGSVLRNALGAITLGAFTTSVFAASNAVQTFNVTMKTVSGSSKAVRTDLAFVRKLATDLAIDLRTAQEQFASFAAASQVAGLEAATTRDIFKSVSIAMTVLNRTTEDQKLSFLALQQMISKGTVSSEELRRQLGERLPGALEIMARALGVGGKELNSMLKAGSILSKDALPKFAKELEKIFGAGVPDALKRTSSQLKLLRNDFEQVLLDVGEAGFMEALTQGVKDFREAIAGPEFQTFVQEIGVGLGRAIKGTAAVLGFLAENADIVKQVILALALIGVSKLLVSFAGLITSSKRLSTAFAAMALSSRLSGTSLAGMNTVMGVTVTRMGRVAFAARAVLRALGPVGILFAAAQIAIEVFSASSDKATEKSQEFKDVLEKLGDSAESAKVALEGVSAEQINLLQFKLEIAAPEAKEAAQDAFKLLQKELDKQQLSFGKKQVDRGFGTRTVEIDLTFGEQKLSEAIETLRTKGRESIGELIDLLNNLGDAPGVEKFKDAISGLILETEKTITREKALIIQRRVLSDQLDEIARKSREVAESLAEVGKEADVDDRLVTKLMDSFRTGGDTVKSFTVKMQSMEKALKDFRVELLAAPEAAAQKVSDDAKKALGVIDGLLESAKKSLNAFKIDEGKAAEALAKAAPGSTAEKTAELELVTAKKGIIQANKDIIESEKDVLRARELTAKTTVNLLTIQRDVTAEATADAAIAVKRTEATIAAVGAAFKKTAPDFAKFVADTQKVALTTKDMELAFIKLEKVGIVLTTEQRTKAIKEFGIALKTAASLADRVAISFEKLEDKEALKAKPTGDARSRFIAAQTKDLRALIAENQKLVDEAVEKDVTTGAEVKSEEAAQKQIDEKSLLLTKKEAAAGRDFDINQIGKLVSIGNKQAIAQRRLTALTKFDNLAAIEKLSIAERNGLSAEEFLAQLKAQAKVQKDLAEPGRVLIEQAREETQLLLLSGKARRDATIVLEVENELKAAGVDLTEKANIAEAKLLVNRRILNAELANPTGFNATLAGIKKLDEALDDVAQAFGDELIDAMANFFTTGKLNFKALADSIIADMARIAAQQVFKGIFNAFTGGTGGFLGGLFDFGSEGGISGSLLTQGRVPLAAFAGAPQFADGTGNTSGGIPSILHDNEAVIPLSRNRKVPVELASGGGGDTVVIENNFNIDARGAEQGVEEKIAEGIKQAAPLIVTAAREASLNDTVELFSRRTL